MLNNTNIGLALILGGVCAAVALTQVDLAKPNMEILPDMKYSPAYSAYSTNSQFTNESTLQTPVSGTIARGQMPLHYAATKEDAVRAGDEISNPYALVSGPLDGMLEEGSQARFLASVARGNELFRVYCVVCHGATGVGDGPVTQRGFPPPPSLLTGNSRQMKDGQLFHILSYGQVNMPSMSSQISSDRRWDVINYVRNLQSATSPAATQDPTQTGS